MEMTLDEVRELVLLAELMRKSAKVWAHESMEDGDVAAMRRLHGVMVAAADLIDHIGEWLYSELTGAAL